MEPSDIKKEIEKLLEKLSVSYTAVEEIIEPWGTTFMIRSDDAPLLIGNEGTHLLSINHLLKRILEKRTEKDVLFTIDVNNYQSKRNEELKMRVKELARKVKMEKTTLELEPMSPFERRIVHATLSEDPEIETKSVGEGRDRHLVISYRE